MIVCWRSGLEGGAVQRRCEVSEGKQRWRWEGGWSAADVGDCIKEGGIEGG